MSTLEVHFGPDDLTNPNLFSSVGESLALPKIWTHWILSEARKREVHIKGVELIDRSGWCLCSADDLLPRVQLEASSTWLTQRASCHGLVTTMVFASPTGRFGAWWVERQRNESEDKVWRSILLEALVLACRESFASAAPTIVDSMLLDH